jgi:hypothetical protein
VNSKRFDMISRAIVGAQPERTTLLGRFAQLAGLLAGGAAPQVAQQQQPRDPNVFEGSCIDFEVRAANDGVLGPNGEKNPKWGGLTIPNVQGSFNYAARVTKQYWKCGCLTEQFDTQSACDTACRAAKCVVLCGGGDVCLETTSVTMNFVANPQVRILSWAPKVGEKALSDDCSKEIARYNTDITTHENRHVQDINAIAREFTQKPRTKKYSACAATTDEAKKKIQDQIQPDYDAEAAALVQALVDKSNEFHGSEAGKIIEPPKCSVCPY